MAVAPGGVETWFNISDNPNFSGETSDTLYSGITTASEKKVRCIVTDANGDKVISKEATLVFTEEEVPLTVSVSEKDLTVEAGSSATLIVKGEGGKAPYTYQWEIATTDGKWTEISDNPFFSGATNSSMKVALTEETTEKFRCVITDAKGKEAISEEITLNVKEIPAQPLSITAQPANITDAALGDYVSFTFSVSGGKAPIKYQWQQKISSASDFKNLTAESTGTMANEGFDTSTLTVKVTNVGSGRYQYRCIVTDANGESLTSDAVSYKIATAVEEKPFAIKTQPVNITAEVGQTAKLFVVAEGGKAPYTYQWQSKDGKNYLGLANNETVSGANTATLSYTAENVGTEYFRCIITDANGTKLTSDTVTMEITPASVTIADVKLEVEGLNVASPGVIIWGKLKSGTIKKGDSLYLNDSGGFYAATIKVVNLEKDRTVTDSVSAPAVGNAMIGILTDLDTATWKNINVTNYVISSVRGIVTTGLGSTGTSDDYYNNVTIIK